MLPHEKLTTSKNEERRVLGNDEVNIFRTVTVKIKRVVLLLLFQFRLTESANFTQENEE